MTILYSVINLETEMNIKAKAGLLATGELLYRLSPIQLETYSMQEYNFDDITGGKDQGNRMRSIRLGLPILSTFVEIKIGTPGIYSNDFGERFNFYQGVKLQLPIATFRASTDGSTNLSVNSVRELLSNLKRPFKYTSLRYGLTKALEAETEESKSLLRERGTIGASDIAAGGPSGVAAPAGSPKRPPQEHSTAKNSPG